MPVPAEGEFSGGAGSSIFTWLLPGTHRTSKAHRRHPPPASRPRPSGRASRRRGESRPLSRPAPNPARASAPARAPSAPLRSRRRVDAGPAPIGAGKLLGLFEPRQLLVRNLGSLCAHALFFFGYTASFLGLHPAWPGSMTFAVWLSLEIVSPHCGRHLACW